MEKISEQVVNKIYEDACINQVLRNVILEKYNLELYQDTYSKCPFEKLFCDIEIREKTQTFICYKCGAGGDVVTLIMKALNLNYNKALEWLMNFYSISDKSIEAENEMYNSAKKFGDVFNNSNSDIMKDILDKNIDKFFLKYENGKYIPDKISIKSQIYKLIQSKTL